MESRFPRLGKPDVNLLEDFFEPTKPAVVDKRAERMVRSSKARGHRSEVKELQDRRDRRGK